MACYILQRKLPWRVYREIGEILVALENITPEHGLAYFKFPDALVRLRGSCTGFQWLLERPRPLPEKSHFLSFQRFAFRIHRFYISQTSTQPILLLYSSSLRFFLPFLPNFVPATLLVSINKRPATFA